jgi:pyrroloquinoline quinone (PQQ) biosynthesis protein C
MIKKTTNETEEVKMTDKAVSLKELDKKLFAMANAQLNSKAYRDLYAVPLDRENAAFYILQRNHFVLNRRCCWAAVQCTAPFDVKGMIWEHEEDELVGDKARGMADHVTLGMMEGESVGLTLDDFARSRPADGVQVAMYAWLHIARDKPWLEAFAASCILEIANSDAVVKSGGNARRIGEKMRDELGIGFEKQASNAEHMEIEIEHATLLSKAAAKYGTTAEAQDQILRGAEASLAIDRVYKAALAEEMAALTDAVAA